MCVCVSRTQFGVEGMELGGELWAGEEGEEWKLWFCPKTVSTLSTFSSPSKKGSKSNSSVSLGSSNQEVTGT